MSEPTALVGSPTRVVPERPEASPVRVVLRDGSQADFAVGPGQTLLEGAMDADVALEHGCGVGACGACAHLVVSGWEHLEPPDELEADSLERYELEGRVRLCCRARTRGPVVLETI